MELREQKELEELVKALKERFVLGDGDMSLFTEEE